ncbi:DUF4838 domain-containing protein [Thiosocius teredinicola]|uniref:DUF4838 domain-containing protein n=1 Tax=Thiosocius teredinicola TaxID=1973002 RepID=UPI0009910198
MPLDRQRVLLFSLVILASSVVAAVDGRNESLLLHDFENRNAWRGSGKPTAHEGREGNGLAVHGGFAMSPSVGRIEVSNPRDLEVTAWVKCTDCRPHSAGIAVLAKNAGDKVLGSWLEGEIPRYWMDRGQSAVLAANETAGWERLTGRIPAQHIPAGTHYLDIYLRADLDAADHATAVFDTLSVNALPPGVVEPTRIMRNGGFEQGRRPWWGKTGKIVDSTSFAGNHALELDSGFVAQDRRPVQAGQNYRISLAVKSVGAPNDSVFVQLSFRGNGVSPGWFGPERIKLKRRTERALLVTGGDSDWRQYSTVVTAPHGANELLLYLRKKKGTPGLAYFDAIETVATTEAAATPASIKLKELRAKLIGQMPPGRLPSGWNDDSTALLIADAQVPHLRIAVQKSPDVVVLNAVGELAEYLQRMSGADFLPIQEGMTPDAQGLIGVGAGPDWMARFFPALDTDSLGADGFAIRAEGQRIVIGGGTARGAMYGVYWFLDRKLGVKWLSPDFTHVPNMHRLSVEHFDTVQIPRFSYREILSHEGEDKRFRAHNLLNGESHGPSFLDSPPEIDVWDQSWLAKGGSANFWQLAQRKKNAKVHPEWFTGGQVAMMNPALRRKTAESVIEQLRRQKDYRAIWFGILDMDWGWDMDRQSAAFAEQHGGMPSAPRLDMMIEVAEIVRESLPGAKLAFNAYHWSMTPPDKLSVPDHILVFPMTINVDYSSALNKGNNLQLGADLVGWNERARHVLVWDHIANFSGFLQPTPNIYPIAESVKWLATLENVQGYFAEGSWNTPSAEFAQLRAWMLSRLLWNPDLDPEEVVREFCELYYGPAAQPVMQYIDLMHRAIRQSGDVLAEKTQVDLKMFNLEFVSEVDAFFDRAEKLAADDPVRLKHVRAARMPIDYVAAARHLDLRNEADAKGIVWPRDNAARIARLMASAKAAGVKWYRQGGDLKKMERMLRVKRKDPTPPPASLLTAANDWHDFQDLSLNRYAATSIVADADASDGGAARIPAGKKGWLIQFKLDKLPSVGAWDLYVAMRPERTAAVSAEPYANVGSYPPMTLFRAVRKAANDSGYQYIKVPGGPFEREVNHQRGIYVQSQTDKDTTGVLVDRIVAVRKK